MPRVTGGPVGAMGDLGLHRPARRRRLRRSRSLARRLLVLRAQASCFWLSIVLEHGAPAARGEVAAPARFPAWRHRRAVARRARDRRRRDSTWRLCGRPLLIALGLSFSRSFLRLDGRREASRLLPRAPIDPRNGVGAAPPHGALLLRRDHRASASMGRCLLTRSTTFRARCRLSGRGVFDRLVGHGDPRLRLRRKARTRAH